MKLISDGCGGQNKNSIMVEMACIWLSKEASTEVKNIVLVYPMVGHSYLPPDRVFGWTEKECRAK